jgi:hypothetical protein
MLKMRVNSENLELMLNMTRVTPIFSVVKPTILEGGYMWAVKSVHFGYKWKTVKVRFLGGHLVCNLVLSSRTF